MMRPFVSICGYVEIFVDIYSNILKHVIFLVSRFVQKILCRKINDSFLIKPAVGFSGVASSPIYYLTEILNEKSYFFV